MLGGLIALIAATTFAWTTAAMRRGVVTGSASQAMTLAIPVGIPVFVLALLLTGSPGVIFDLSPRVVVASAVVGITHFIIGRYFNYRAYKAFGLNLAGPVAQFSLIVAIGLAMAFLGEVLNVVRIVAIVLIVLGPFLAGQAGKSGGKAAPLPSGFTPRYVEGYVFAILGAVVFGFTPVLIRYAVHDQSLPASVASGLISVVSSTIVTAFILLWPGQWRELKAVDPEAAKWLLLSGLMVYVSQVFTYMAFALAPVTVVSPIIGLAVVLRLHMSRLLNPHHEVFGPKIVVATVLSFVGVVLMSLSTETIPLPEPWAALFRWHWP